MDTITQHLRAIEMQNNAILVRQDVLAGMLVLLCAYNGKEMEKYSKKLYKQMGSLLDEYYTKPLKKMMDENES